MVDLRAARRARQRGLTVTDEQVPVGPLAPQVRPAAVGDTDWTPGWRAWPDDETPCWRLYFIWGALPERGVSWRLRTRDAVLTAMFGPQMYLLYIGVTGQYVPACRALNHVIKKGWAPDIRLVEISARTWPSEEAALRAETHAIRTRRPLHNIAQNVGNPVAADSAQRRLPRHRRAARRHATVRLALLLAFTAGVWSTTLTLAEAVPPLRNALSSGVGALLAVLWSVTVVLAVAAARGR